MPDLTFRVNADISGVKRGLDQARSEISRALGSIGGVGGLLTAAGATAGLERIISSHLEQAKEVAKLAQLANSSITEASKLLSTAEAFGVTSDKLSVAIRNVSRSASAEPQLFKDIGVATEDASGKSRSAIDIFNDVRNTLAGANNDYRTTAIGAKILGKSIEEILPFLRASEDQVRRTTQAATDMGIVMSEEDVKAALAFAGSMAYAEGQGRALSQMIAGTLIPMLGNLTEAAFVAKDMLVGLFTTQNARVTTEDSNIPVIGGIANAIGNVGDILFGRKTDALQKINDAVNQQAKIRADFAKLASQNLLGGTGGDFTLPSLAAGGKDALIQAIRDRIDAIREEAKARQDALRESLDGFTKERDVAIRTIQDEQNARQASHETEIRAIEDEQRAMDAAFTARERVRSDELDALREQIRGTEELANLEQRRQDVADAEAQLQIEQGVEVFRAKSMSANDYTRAVMDQSKRVKDAETKLADSRKALAKDEAKVQIEERIRAIEAAAAADKRALEDYKTNSEERLRTIRDQMAVEKNQADTRIQQLRDEQAAARDRMTTIIDAIQKETDAVVKGLDAQLKAAQGLASAYDAVAAAAIRAALARGGGAGTGTTVETGAASMAGKPVSTQPGAASEADVILGATRDDIINAYRTLLGRDPENEGAITGRLGRPVTSVYSEIFGSPEAYAYRHRGDSTINFDLGPAGAPSSGAMPVAREYPADFPRIGFAAGGEGIITEPTLLVNARTRRAYASVAENGPEPFRFGGSGTRTAGGREAPTVVNAYGIGIDEAAAKIAAMLERSKARRASRGYGLRR